MLKQMKIEIVGVTPLLMHNGAGADPLHPMSVKLKELTGIRKKTREIHIEIQHIEFMKSIYVDAKGRPIIPSNCIEATLVNGAKKERLGKQFTAAVFCDEDARLMYKGPTSASKLWEDSSFRLVVPARVQQARVMRCRPMFRKWSAEFTIKFDNDEVDASTVERVARTAGRLVGLLDWRPKFGRFAVKKVGRVSGAK